MPKRGRGDMVLVFLKPPKQLLTVCDWAKNGKLTEGHRSSSLRSRRRRKDKTGLNEQDRRGARNSE